MKALDHQVRISQFALVFHLKETRVRRSLKNGPQDPAPLGRRAALDEEWENVLIAYIQERNGQLHSLTEKEFLLFVEKNFDKTLTKGWTHAFLCHH
jgi:hypothetical protein